MPPFKQASGGGGGGGACTSERPVTPPDADADGAVDIVAYTHEDGDGDGQRGGGGWGALENRNVVRVLGFCFLDGASHSIWRQDAFQVLVESLGGDTAVGWMSAAAGITQMLSAVVAGYAGDRLKRETVLRAGSIAGFIAVACTMLGATTRSLTVFYVSQAICGVYTGVAATSTEAIFADSVETGRRAFVYNLKWIDQTLCSCVGLIVSICVLVYLGNSWAESALVKTMYCGLCMHPFAMAVLWTLRDKYTLNDDAEEEEAAADAAWAAGAMMAGMEPGRVGHAAPVACGAGISGGNNGVPRSDSEVELMRSTVNCQPHRSTEDDKKDGSDAIVANKGRGSGAAAAGAASPLAASEDTPWSGDTPVRPAPPSCLRRDGGNGGEKRVHWSEAPPTVFPAAVSPTEASSPGGRSQRSCGQRLVQRQLEQACEVEKQEFFAAFRAAGWWGRILVALRYYSHVVFTWEAVPYLVCLVDFLVAFGSGMTMRYLSLFFVKDYHSTPMTLLTASLMISPLQALISHLVQRGGDLYLGRLPSTIVARVIGTTLLLLMGTTELPLNVLLPIYIFRNALMNSTRGVTRSVIMDCVRKENRAKWSAFESFSSFTWAGSAVIGGYIAAAQGYKATFTITAFFHYCSLAVLLPGAIGALPVERELMRANRGRPHSSCTRVMIAVAAILVVGALLFWGLRVAVEKRGW